MSDILIIGGSSGIGLATAQQLLAQGANVTATFNSKNTDQAPGVNFFHLDVMDQNASMDFIPESLDGLVYCPGSINLRPFERIKPADFERDYHLQVVGAIRIIQAALPALRKSGNASILLFSTVAVRSGLPFHSLVSASKGAIEGLCVSLAAEFAPKVRVNCIAPSLTETPLAAQLINTEQKKELNAARHPMKRIGSPADIANMATFLLSPQASWITGQVLHVDGGMSAIR
ncbi:MAG: SDR family oxidoreductase [Chitinophagaceae bacterium]|nr:MAG: SDR family oxidoreductase [Chitinophagaceae bacterium]